MILDIETVQALLLKVAIFAPITLGLVQAVKQMFPDSWLRFVPLVAIAIGIGFGWYFVQAGPWGVLAGIALGLSSVGLFEFGKTTIGGRG